ncbi:MAG: fatty acid desaturase [Solirubrobacterales bacterium]
MEAATAEPHLEVTWRDPKRYLWLLGLIVPMIPFIAWALVEVTGLGIFWWFGPFLVFAVIPFFDLVIGKDSENPPDSALKWLEGDRYYRWCTYLFLPLQFASLIFACWWWASGELSFLENLGLAFSVAMVAGIAINTAHELGHKTKNGERWLSKVALAQSGYGHFFIEHNRGHHVRVATAEDPASSRLGESFWAFLPRTVSGSLTSALHLERLRLDRVGKGFWTIHNDVLNAWAMTVVLFGGLCLAFGIEVLPWLAVQAVVGFSLLEVVNYLEHYGLRRQWDEEKGRYELCRPEHSWNSNNIASNVFLYHLQRHSDHHANPVRRYQALRHFDEVPELPSGYATMIVLAYATPLWRRVMDPKVVAHYGGDLSLANVQPRKRKKLAARWGTGAGAAGAAGAPSTSAAPAVTAATGCTTATATPNSATAAAPNSATAEREITIGDAVRPKSRSHGGEGRRGQEDDGSQGASAAHRCPGCGFTYSVAAGAPREGFPAGTPWSEVPAGWNCPDCGVRVASDFEPVGAGATVGAQ